MSIESRMTADTVTVMLRERGWPVMGVFVGGCISRGPGSSFRAAAHTHTAPDDAFAGTICIRSAKRVLTPSGKPSRLLLHEVAHVLAPKAKHGSPAFVKALAAVGLKTDSYSRAGRNRRDGRTGRARRSVVVHSHLAEEPCPPGCPRPYEEAAR